MESTVKVLRNELRPLIVATIALMLITAIAYPLAVTGVAQLLFHHEAHGSLLQANGQDVGSSLMGQTFTKPEYFHPRPSAAGSGYDGASSGGSNLGPTSAKLVNGVPGDHSTTSADESFAGIEQRVAAYRAENGLAPGAVVPADAVTASASGLDPDISPANARLQVDRVARTRGADPAAVQKLVDSYTGSRSLGFVGQPRVNVLKLNLALDARFPLPASK